MVQLQNVPFFIMERLAGQIITVYACICAVTRLDFPV